MELLAPGGTLETALVALEAGADAVYVGLKKFSARSAAANLDAVELRRLTAAAETAEKRVYLALNTIVTEAEWPAFRETAWAAADAGVNALIVQDWGVLSWLRRHLPDLAIHASTQMAVHNAPGARFLRDLGVRRVVLARELTMAEIQTIADQVPGIELETFIHGALCFGASGLCLASGHLLGRSANRGECAQICRTWFEGPGGKQYPFSTRDLRLGPLVLALQPVTSLKIEGRMKGPAYVESTVRYYRSLLDGRVDEAAGEASRLAFSRPSTEGFLTQSRGENLLAPDYPGHRGVPLGSVVGRRGGGLLVALDHDLEVRDGVLAGLVPSAVRGLRWKGKAVYEAHAGLTVEVDLDPVPPNGVELRLLHHGPGPRFHPVVPEPRQQALTLTFLVSPGRVSWTARGFPGGGTVEGQADLPLEASRNSVTWSTVLESALGGPKEQSFRISRVEWDNQTGWEGIFVPPSAWKGFRRSLWAAVALGPDHRRTGPNNGWLPEPFPADPKWAPDQWPDFARPTEVPGDVTVLRPLQFSPPRDLEPLELVLEKRTDPFLLVVNNVGHLEMARRLAVHPGARFALGYGFHAANREAVALLTSLLPRVTAVCGWNEGEEALFTGWGGALVVPPKRQRRAPDFLSRFCVRRHAWAGDCRNCSGSWNSQLTQNGQTWELRSEGCITTVHRVEPPTRQT